MTQVTSKDCAGAAVLLGKRGRGTARKTGSLQLSRITKWVCSQEWQYVTHQEMCVQPEMAVKNITHQEMRVQPGMALRQAKLPVREPVRVVSYIFLPSGVATRPRNASEPSAFCSRQQVGAHHSNVAHEAPEATLGHGCPTKQGGKDSSRWDAHDAPLTRPSIQCTGTLPSTHMRPAGNGGSAGAVQGCQERALAHNCQASLLVVESSKRSGCTAEGITGDQGIWGEGEEQRDSADSVSGGGDMQAARHEPSEASK